MLRKSPYSERCNDEVKTAVVRKEAAWRNILGANDEIHND